jgi:Tol biopolymer transport system component
MTGLTDIERMLDAYLAPEADALSDRVFEAAFGEIARTPQRRALRAPWRFPSMPTFARPTALVFLVAALLIAGGAFYLAGQTSPQPTMSPAPTSLQTPSPTPSPTPLGARTADPSLGLEVGPGAQAGGTIVFGLHDQATNTDRLYLIAPDGTGARFLSDAGTCCPTVAPDGRAVLLAQELDGRMVPAIRGLPSAGPSLDESAQQWSDFAPGLSLLPGAWSRDYNLAFQGWSKTNQAKTGIYLSIDNGGGLIIGGLVRLTTQPGREADIPIAFSHDGSKLLFVRETPNAAGTGDLYVIGLDGAGQRKLNPDDVGVPVSDIFGPGASWNTNGTRVAFSAYDRAGEGFSSTSRAYVVDVAGGAASRITPDSTNMTSAHWSPNGSWIAYDFGEPGHNEVWVVRPDGTGARQITSTAGSCCAVWSPDSSLLLFEGNDADGAGMFIARADGSGYSRLLTVASEYDLRWRRWAP